MFSSQLAAGEAREYVARAYQVESGRVIYTEHHQEVWRDGELTGGRIEYRDPAGATFARKELFFERNLVAPSFRMVDDRDGFQEGASWGDGGLQLFAGRGDDSRTKVIASPPSDAVIDAGFHRYIQSKLPELMGGENDEFSFAVPSYGRFFRFRVSMVEAFDDGRVRLRMRPASAFLRFLVDPIELIYDQDGRLLEFEGMTNIPDEAGERHLARIVFTYPDVSDATPQIAAAG